MKEESQDQDMPFTVMKTPTSPEEWLQRQLEQHMKAGRFFACIMDCYPTHGPAAIVRCIPSNFFEDFKEFIDYIAKYKDENNFIVIGRPIEWGVADARAMMKWLAENPNPEVAPPDEWQYVPKEGEDLSYMD